MTSSPPSLANQRPVLAGTRILVTAQPRADHLDAALIRRGASVTCAPTESVLELAASSYDAVVVTSAPAALAWLEELAFEGVTEIVRDLVASGRLLLAAVGPMAAAPLIDAGMAPVFPNRSRMVGLVRLVIMTLGDSVHGIATPAGVLRVRACAATLDDAVLPLSPNGLTVLRRLAQTPGEVVSRDALLRALPGGSDDPHTAEVAIARLRDALGSRQLVRTVIKRGYVLQVVA
jgi:uroporphyrinogen-III synthase